MFKQYSENLLVNGKIWHVTLWFAVDGWQPCSLTDSITLMLGSLVLKTRNRLNKQLIMLEDEGVYSKIIW